MLLRASTVQRKLVIECSAKVFVSPLLTVKLADEESWCLALYIKVFSLIG